jgi:glucose-6-phosphate 1-dehydrogenase
MSLSATLLLFGATGDLTKRKLIPALYSQFERGELEPTTPIIGIGRRELSKEQFIAQLEPVTFLEDYDEATLQSFLSQVYYCSIDFNGEVFTELYETVLSIEKRHNAAGNRLFYLAMPSSLFKKTIRVVELSGLLEGPGWRRVVFEKPFGHDLLSAKTLHDAVSRLFREEQIFRIDHYLGKELVQNILVFRFGNPMLNEIWNTEFIDHVQVTVAETVGVEQRSGYYDESGALKDMVQNHLLQVVSLVAMEEPSSLAAAEIIKEKQRVLECIAVPSPDEVVLGQYGRGTIGKDTKNEQQVPGYREEKGIPEDSVTETFAALKLGINTERWNGVPFYIRTGKRMAHNYSEVNLYLKNQSCKLFGNENEGRSINRITVRIKPDEGLVLTLNVKEPGTGITLRPVSFSFCHRCEFGGNTPEAYDMLLRQAIAGDHTLFISRREIEESWKLIDRIIDFGNRERAEFPNYTAGTYGPRTAEMLLERDGRSWLPPVTQF